MNNVTKKIIPIALLITAVFSSCKKFLDIPPESIYAEENLFITTNHAEMNVFGIYSILTSGSLYGRNITQYYDLDTDLAQIKGGTSSGAPDGERRSIARYAFTSTTRQISDYWVDAYKGVERANIAIAKIPQMELYEKGTDVEKKKLKRCYGEALTLRAILYLDLVRHFGDVPLKLTPSVTGENFNLPRTSRDVIYDQLVKDLQEAEELVPWANDTGITVDERITKGAVKGILARVALYAAGYSLRWDLQTGSVASLKMGTRPNVARIRELYTVARDECNEIMLSTVHRLNPSFENVWKNIAAYRIDNVYRENIMEIAFYSRLSVRGEAGYYGNYNGPESRILSAPAHGTSAGAMWVMPSFYLSYDPEDSRRDITAASHIFTAQPKGTPTALYNLTVGKWRNGWAATAPSSLTNFNFPLLRYADVLLMFAEADSWLNNGSTPAAVDALKLVRKRAFPTKIAAIEAEVYPTNLNDFIEVLINERAFELAFEGFRKTDLIRFNKLAEKINWAKAENEAINNSYSSTGNRPYTGSIVRLQGKVIPTSRVYKDTGNSYGVEIRETSTRPDNTWGSVQWLGAAFKANMAIFASGFKENYSEIYPVPLGIRDVTTAIGQVPGY